MLETQCFAWSCASIFSFFSLCILVITGIVGGMLELPSQKPSSHWALRVKESPFCVLVSLIWPPYFEKTSYTYACYSVMRKPKPKTISTIWSLNSHEKSFLFLGFIQTMTNGSLFRLSLFLLAYTTPANGFNYPGIVMNF